VKRKFDRSQRALIRSIWFSAAFTILSLVMLGITIGDHYGILTIPDAIRPVCSGGACGYPELIRILLFLTAGGAVLHLATRLIRWLFAPQSSNS
jgi:hypothetical protein